MEVNPEQLQRALEKANDTLIKYLQKRLPGSSSFFTTVLKLDYEDSSFALVIDVYVRRRNVKGLEALLEEAIDEARRVFEMEAGIKTSRKNRVNIKKIRKDSNFSS